jgi:dipeptide/tripeptide permease
MTSPAAKPPTSAPDEPSGAPAADAGAIPKYDLRQQLRMLFGSRVFNLANFMEVLERLAYYGLRTVVPVYMVLAVEHGGPQFDHKQKGLIFAYWALVQSLIPVFSGGFADRHGYKLTVGVAIAFKAVGYLVMAWCVEGGAMLSGGASVGVPGHWAVLTVFMAGALLLAFGTAVFKPGLQGMIAVSMPPGTKVTGWAVFYQLVNVGGFFGPYLASAMKLLAWKWVFIACAIIVCLNYLVLLTFKEPKHSGEGFGKAGALSMLWQSLIGIFEPRLLCFTVLFSGYWLMFNQLFDILPNFIDDWVDTRGPLDAVTRPLLGLFGAEVPAAWEGRLPQEHMINVNAFICMTIAFLAGYATSRLRAITAMAIGIGLSCIAIYALGLSMNGWFTIAAIAGFSFGEICASPRKAEYLASLAPPGREGLYLGYVNATQAVGWSIGSILAGKLYESGGDKVVLARRMLVERFGQDPAQVEAMEKTAVVPHLSQQLGVDALGTTRALWEAYHPYSMWSVFALIGLSSMVGLLAYGWLVKKLRAKDEWVFAAMALLYSWAIFDERSFTRVPRYALGFGSAMLLYVVVRKYRPAWLPAGAKASS